MMMPFTINVQERRSERARVHSQNILFGEKHKLMMVKLFFFFRKEGREFILQRNRMTSLRLYLFFRFLEDDFFAIFFCKINLMPNDG